MSNKIVHPAPFTESSINLTEKQINHATKRRDMFVESAKEFVDYLKNTQEPNFFIRRSRLDMCMQSFLKMKREQYYEKHPDKRPQQQQESTQKTEQVLEPIQKPQQQAPVQQAQQQPEQQSSGIRY